MDVFSRAFSTCALIYDPILPCVSLRTLVQLALTCRVSYLAVADYKTRAFNINRHLSRYFSNPIAFRSLQAKTNTLISGSNALQFLDRSFYLESDLDLYTHPGHSFEVAQFLVEAEGYAFVPSNRQSDSGSEDWRDTILNDWDGTDSERRIIRFGHDVYPLEGINEVFTFQKPAMSGQGTMKIQIVEATASPVQAILGFHSTCVMNLISSDAAYALYPLATLVERSALGMPKAMHAPTAIAKYIDRGWRVYFSPRPEDLAFPKEPPFLLDKPRWVGDKHTLVVPLDQTGVKPRPPLSPGSQYLTFDPAKCYGWNMVPVYGGEPWNGYKCKTYTVHSTVFRYNYAFPDENVANALIHWAARQGKYCHLTIPKGNWTWFDGDIPSFLWFECDRDIVRENWQPNTRLKLRLTTPFV